MVVNRVAFANSSSVIFLRGSNSLFWDAKNWRQRTFMFWLPSKSQHSGFLPQARQRTWIMWMRWLYSPKTAIAKMWNRKQRLSQSVIRFLWYATATARIPSRNWLVLDGGTAISGWRRNDSSINDLSTDTCPLNLRQPIRFWIEPIDLWYFVTLRTVPAAHPRAVQCIREPKKMNLIWPIAIDFRIRTVAHLSDQTQFPFHTPWLPFNRL